MDTKELALELIEVESAAFASQVYDVMTDDNDFCKSTMAVIIDELVNDMLSQVQDTADQAKMFSMILGARLSLKDVMVDEKGEE